MIDNYIAVIVAFDSIRTPKILSQSFPTITANSARLAEIERESIDLFKMKGLGHVIKPGNMIATASINPKFNPKSKGLAQSI